MFETILEHDLIKAYLKKALHNRCLPQTLLFSGPDGVGKRLLAKEVATHLLQSAHSPDLHLLAPEGKSGLYAIDTLREMIDQEHEAPYESLGKVFILEEVDRMQPACANALLKTLEEPTEETTFILLTTRQKDILPTLLSRCAILSFSPLSQKAIETILQAQNLPPHFAKWAHGSAGKAVELATEKNLEKERELLFQLLAQKPSYPELYQKLSLLEELLEEGKEEDPVRASRRVEYLFASILMWHRDQHLRKIGGGDLFFPEEPACEPADLLQIEKKVAEAQLAYQRNMKLSLCFQRVIPK